MQQQKQQQNFTINGQRKSATLYPPSVGWFLICCAHKLVNQSGTLKSNHDNVVMFTVCFALLLLWVDGWLSIVCDATCRESALPFWPGLRRNYQVLFHSWFSVFSTGIEWIGMLKKVKYYVCIQICRILIIANCVSLQTMLNLIMLSEKVMVIKFASY